ncbi:MAG: aminodeoxychorismate synthase component I [Gammaproteobacteria bacterium]|nr:aminodeoxychorismate synthase component I [Gammaproteobacteria bacterium]MBU1601489.1 aminodeoxychorismate synthase component I [Gammaproteobacteria bacterium]MBU2433684.1 aminodeoxychorismate synthase component I [Gammaproteobacteria bacterium]MBU2449778.1 aminodeoxychorismate synthase component I [Gammaproteobacteria bacterium]
MASLEAVLQTLQDDPQWTVVGLDYELGYLLEPKSAPLGWQPDGRVLARFWRFSERISLSAQDAEAWLQQPGRGVGGIGDVQPAIDEESFVATVNRIKRLIFEGDCYQVNFTFPLDFAWFGSPLALYARLRQRQPVRYGGFVGDAAQGLLSLSPELFLERCGDRLLTKPMKGTAPRSAPPEQLRDSEKDRAENLMIVDLLRNDLGRVAELGSVAVDRLFDIEDYPTLWQMVSEVSAKVGGRSFGEILRALFPCGSITGAPKIRAMQIAAELENAERGIYTGALGWLAPDGDFRLNVAIRTLELGADGRGKLGVGSGIVADSQPAAEWQECLLKSRFLQDCDPGLLLIETLRREDGRYPRLAGHLERLRRSAAWLGFACDETRLAELLAAQPVAGTWRVRLTLAKDGRIDVLSFPLTAEADGPRHAVLAARAIESGYPLRRHKTTDRALYDAALKGVAGDAQVFDVVFLNERGEVAEGARSTVFVERDGVLQTPPLASGALPGVLRAALLANGQAREAVLYPADLADGFWLGNALRGLMRVSLRSTGKNGQI